MKTIEDITPERICRKDLTVSCYLHYAHLY